MHRMGHLKPQLNQEKAKLLVAPGGVSRKNKERKREKGQNECRVQGHSASWPDQERVAPSRPNLGGWVVATCPLAGALSHPLPLILYPCWTFLLTWRRPQSRQTSQGPFPSATVPTLTFRLWWQLLSLMTWPPPACGLQGAGSREVEAPLSTLSKVFLFCPPIPRNPGPAGGHLSWRWKEMEW